MPIIKSAKKRVRQTSKAKSRNDVTRKDLRSAIKKLQASLTSKKGASDSLSAAQSSIDKAVKKGLIHKNKAARKKSQLAAAAKANGVKLEKSATPKAKPAVKRSPVAPKATSGKAVAKKPATKKIAPKKAPSKKK